MHKTDATFTREEVTITMLRVQRLFLPIDVPLYPSKRTRAKFNKAHQRGRDNNKSQQFKAIAHMNNTIAPLSNVSFKSKLVNKAKTTPNWSTYNMKRG